MTLSQQALLCLLRNADDPAGFTVAELSKFRCRDRANVNRDMHALWLAGLVERATIGWHGAFTYKVKQEGD